MMRNNKLGVLTATALSITGLMAIPLVVGGVTPSFKANPPYVGPVAQLNDDGTVKTTFPVVAPAPVSLQ
jgi:hypothetical protein